MEILLGVMATLIGIILVLWKKTNLIEKSKDVVNSNVKSFVKGKVEDAGKNNLAQSIRDFNKSMHE